MNITDQAEIDRMLFALELECARPSVRFRDLFTENERHLLGHAFSTLRGQRQFNSMMNELERRYGPNLGRNAAGGNEAQQSGQAVCTNMTLAPGPEH
jgi:hypothetical protein